MYLLQAVADSTAAGGNPSTGLVTALMAAAAGIGAVLTWFRMRRKKGA